MGEVFGSAECSNDLLQCNQDVIETFTDSDWATDKASRKSTSGGLICINANPVFYWSRTQRSVSTSSAEAEYIALAGGMQEGIWTQRVWDFINQYEYTDGPLTEDESRSSNRSRLVMRCDSSAARSLCNKVGVNKLKHISISLLWCQQMVKQRRLSVLAVGTLVNPADVFTKQLGVARVMMLLYLMRVVEMHRYKRMGEFEFWQATQQQAGKLSVRDALKILQVHVPQAANMTGAKQIVRAACVMLSATSADGADIETCVNAADGVSLWTVCMMFGIVACLLCGLIFWLWRQVKRLINETVQIEVQEVRQAALEAIEQIMNRSADGWYIEETSRESEEALDQNELRSEMFSRQLEPEPDPDPVQATRPTDDSATTSAEQIYEGLRQRQQFAAEQALLE